MSKLGRFAKYTRLNCIVRKLKVQLSISDGRGMERKGERKKKEEEKRKRNPNSAMQKNSKQ